MKKSFSVLVLMAFWFLSLNGQDEHITLDVKVKPRLFTDYHFNLPRYYQTMSIGFDYNQQPQDLQVGDIFYTYYDNITSYVFFEPASKFVVGAALDFKVRNKSQISMGLGYKFQNQQTINEINTTESVPYIKNEVVSVGFDGPQMLINQTYLSSIEIFDGDEYYFGNVQCFYIGSILVPIQYSYDIFTKFGFIVGVTPHIPIHASSHLISKAGFESFAYTSNSTRLFNQLYTEGNIGLKYNIGKYGMLNLQANYGINSLISQSSNNFYNVDSYNPYSMSIGYSSYFKKSSLDDKEKGRKRKTKKSKRIQE